MLPVNSAVALSMLDARTGACRFVGGRQMAELAADLAACSGCGEGERRAVRRQAWNHRQVGRGTLRETPRAGCAGGGGL